MISPFSRSSKRGVLSSTHFHPICLFQYSSPFYLPIPIMERFKTNSIYIYYPTAANHHVGLRACFLFFINPRFPLAQHQQHQQHQSSYSTNTLYEQPFIPITRTNTPSYTIITDLSTFLFYRFLLFCYFSEGEHAHILAWLFLMTDGRKRRGRK